MEKFFLLLSWLQELLIPFEPLFKLISFVIGPAIALVAFMLNRKDRAEIMAQAEALGRAKEQAELAAKAAADAKANADKRAGEAEKLQSELEGITKGADQLWKLRPPRPFANYRAWYLERDGAVTLTIGNLKGGVGKTTLAANFAAYLSETMHKRVLLIDLDYQGSLSNLLLQALNLDQAGSNVNALFRSTAGLAEVLQSRIHLVPKTEDISGRLSRAWIVPANYEYGTLENQLLLSWLLNRDGELDVRYLLAHALLQPNVRRDYDAIIFDMPPRLTLGAINALVASHHFFVPTVLDKLSVEAVPQFLSNVAGMKKDLGLGVELAGIIGTLTRVEALSVNEELYLSQARDAGHVWNKERDYVLGRTVPRRTAIADAAGQEIAYMLSNNPQRTAVRTILDPLFADMAARIGLK
jgi:cellulose biosynthesis protein BcsQ